MVGFHGGWDGNWDILGQGDGGDGMIMNESQPLQDPTLKFEDETFDFVVNAASWRCDRRLTYDVFRACWFQMNMTF